MSEEKVTPVPRTKGTPKRMRPLLLSVTYYLVAVVGILQILTGLYLSYETGILGRSASSFISLQPPTLVTVIEFFSGIFAIVAALGLRRLAYWGGLSIAIFGVFEFLNSGLLTQIIQFGLFTTLGMTLSNPLSYALTLILQGLGVLIAILSGISSLGIRRHRRVAGLMRG